MIEITFDLGDLDNEADQAIYETIMEAARALALVGEEYIIESRSKGSYTDRTGNLRNANSYAVYYEGVALFFAFGKPETEASFNKLKEGTGLEFICGNGMEYCSYVEGRGFNVVSSGFLKVQKRINQIF